MKTKAKVALIAGAAIVGVAGGIWFSWCSGINYERRYKKLFDKTFKGDYKITVTKSGFTLNPEAPLKLPFRYWIYDIEYKDKNGNVRHTGLDSRVGYSTYFPSDEKLIGYIKNRNLKNDINIMAFLESEMNDLVKEDMQKNIMPKYFDFNYDPENNFRNESDGYSIVCFPFASCSLYVDETYNIDKMREFISPANCPVLSDMDMKTFANTKTSYLYFLIEITDESKYELKDEYVKKVEAMMDEYTAASDFGGNYRYRVRTLKEDEDEIKTLDTTEVYVLYGEEMTFDPNTDNKYQKYKDMIAEKCGYDISEK